MDRVAAPPESPERRAKLVDLALLLVTLSVIWGALSGSLSIVVGLLDHSLGVLGVGLNVLADLAGSAVLIWRFHAERRRPSGAPTFETRAAVVVATALGLAATVLAIEAVRALLSGSHPGTSVPALAIAGATLLVLTPLAVAKRRVGSALASSALKGDGTLSAVGAATALLALVTLLLYREFGLWWADRVAALFIAAVAGVGALRTWRTR
jgi:divalent metal cation (Fe/Co/Zn/Cd) transporter